MKRLRNWDNKTWLSSKKYVTSFNTFLKSKINFNQDMQILDIGCGRANIISNLQKKYKFKDKPIGIDIIKNSNIKKNIFFYKIDAINYLNKTNKNFDVILIKQTIHFLNKNKILTLLNKAKSKLNNKGHILIFSLNGKKNKIPCFKKMKLKLNKSFEKDEILFKIIKENLKNFKQSYFKYTVNISKKKYVSMINNRYMSCLLNINKKDLIVGSKEINTNFNKQIKFEDNLNCISFRKLPFNK